MLAGVRVADVLAVLRGALLLAMILGDGRGIELEAGRTVQLLAGVTGEVALAEAPIAGAAGGRGIRVLGEIIVGEKIEAVFP